MLTFKSYPHALRTTGCFLQLIQKYNNFNSKQKVKTTSLFVSQIKIRLSK